jgi:hypothetical protein
VVPDEGGFWLEIEDLLHNHIGQIGQEDHAHAEAPLADEDQLVVELVTIAPSVYLILICFC